MQAYSELLPPTAVTHALNLPFLDPNTPTLIVAKTTVLQIFEITQVPVSELSVNGTSTIPAQAQHVPNGEASIAAAVQTRLILIAEYDLPGVVTSLARIKALNTKTGGEALLVSFRDAKISLVEWDPLTYSISTISIHFYEGETLQGGSLSPDLSQCSTFLTADPSSRAAALKFGENHLAVIPFRQVGDDLAEADFDSEMSHEPAPAALTEEPGVETSVKETPYGSSFVLSLSSLDPNVIFPVDLAFLHEYREPTLGVLSSAEEACASLTQERKDILTYTAFTLDLEQRARTILLSVPNLPSDLFKLEPLPMPVGGALLIGGNELIHVDQSGRTHGVAVNEMARHASSFPMADQSDLNLMLDRSVAIQVNSRNGDMFLFLSSGEIVAVSFHIEGRSVSGFSLKRLSDGQAGKVLHNGVSCATTVDRDLVFVGSEDADSFLIRFSSQRSQLSRKRSHAEALGEDGSSDMDDEDDEEDEDDLYAEGPRTSNGDFLQGKDSASMEFKFSIEDYLPNLTALGEPCFAKSSKALQFATSQEEYSDKIQMAFPSGRDGVSGLTFVNKQAHLSIDKQLHLSKVTQTWSLNVSEPSDNTTNGDIESKISGVDQFLITTGMDDSRSVSRLHRISSSSAIEEVNESYFDNDSETLGAGVLCGGKRIVQVSPNEIRCLDPDLALAQLIPMLDENTDAELEIQQTCFCDPYLLVLRTDSSIVIFKVDERGELEPLDRGEAFIEHKWASGCVYQPKVAASDPLVFLLTTDGTLLAYQLPDLDNALYVIESVNLMPPLLAPENFFRRAPTRENIVELLVADLGVYSLRHPYLILRTADNNLTVYRSYYTQGDRSKDKFTENLRWLKIEDSTLIRAYGFAGEDQEQPYSRQAFRAIPNLDGYSTVFLRCNKPKLILAEPTSMARIIEVSGNPLDLSPINTLDCKNGVVVVDNAGEASLARLPPSTRFGDAGWAVRRKELGAQIQSLCYHASSNHYVLGFNESIPFNLPGNDDWHSEWATENSAIKPTGSIAKLKLFDPVTFTIVSEVDLEPDEIITTVKDVLLETSEITHAQRKLIAVGTAVIKGEDLPSNGNIYIFDIIEVVPEPDRPETNRSLKQIAKEEVKGAVTDLCEIGSDGFLFTSQGQKCMVRGLKEDNTMLPVAFLDVQCTVTTLRNVKNTGMVLIGDVFKGLYLAGFSTEPYRIRLFGKSRMRMEVVAADFLPQGKQLFVIVADTGCDLHILEFNPEDPKSLSGQRLLHRNIFHTGHFPTAIISLPTSAAAPDPGLTDGDTSMEGTEDVTTSPYNTLLMSRSGALAVITPVDEQSYRRLSALQIYLTGFLDHPCGLNPRAFRAIESEASGGRGVLDGQILKRWYSLSSQRKAEASTRVGSDVWQVSSDLEMISGAGMNYL